MFINKFIGKSECYKLSIPYLLFAFITILLAQGNAKATVFTEPVEIISMAERSESILIGTPTSATNKISSQGNLFTEIILSDTSALQNSRFEAIDETFTIFLWGGVKDERGNPATFDTPPPHYYEYMYGTPRLEIGTQFLFFLNQNGSTGMPFIDNEYGVFRVLDNGQLVSSNNRLKIKLISADSTQNNLVLQSTLPSRNIDILTLEADDNLINNESGSISELNNVRDATIDDIAQVVSRRVSRFRGASFNNDRPVLNAIFIE